MNIKIDEIIRTKRKTIALIITQDARLVVRSPIRTPLSEIINLVERKQNWIREKQNLMLNRQKVVKEKTLQDNSEVLYLGQKYILKLNSELDSIEIIENQIHIPNKFSTNSNLEFEFKKWLIIQSEKIIYDRLIRLSEPLGLNFTSIRISDAKTRWGSCSGRNRINISWRLIMAPIPVIDYVILHELIHTLIKNHSKNFWNKVQLIMPDYKIRKQWLKNNHKYFQF